MGLIGMRTFVLLVLVLADFLIGRSEAVTARGRLMKSIRKCRNLIQVDDNEIEMLKQQKLPDSDAGKCFIACIMTESKVLKNGKFLKQNAFIVAEIMHKNSPETIEKIKLAVEICTGNVPIDPNECEFAMKLSSCLLDQAKKRGVADLKIWT